MLYTSKSVVMGRFRNQFKFCPCELYCYWYKVLSITYMWTNGKFITNDPHCN